MFAYANADGTDEKIPVNQEYLELLREEVDFYGKILKDPDIWLETNSIYILPVWMHREKAVQYLRWIYLTELRALGKSFDEKEFTNRIERFRNNSDEAKNELGDIIKIIQSDIEKLERKKPTLLEKRLQPTGKKVEIISLPSRQIIGQWRWFNGMIVHCKSDGTCVASNGLSGQWKWLSEKGKFEIFWFDKQGSQFVDTLEMSSDQKQLIGSNQYGDRVSARRDIQLPSSQVVDSVTRCNEIIGSWIWSNGAIVQCKRNGVCTATNGFSGQWKCLKPRGQFQFSWSRSGRAPFQFIDTLDLSEDGNRLSGRNHFGVSVSAKRQ